MQASLKTTGKKGMAGGKDKETQREREREREKERERGRGKKGGTQLRYVTFSVANIF